MPMADDTVVPTQSFSSQTPEPTASMMPEPITNQPDSIDAPDAPPTAADQDMPSQQPMDEQENQANPTQTPNANDLL